MKRKNTCRFAFGATVIFLSLAPAYSAQLSIALVPIGDPGNAPDTLDHSGRGAFGQTVGAGAVPYLYSIGKFDVTAQEYAVFLNAVAATDTYSLYNPDMANLLPNSCGIQRFGTSGHYTYATTRNSNYPVNFVNWGDAARFVNWLQNGQPVGPQGNSTTERGSYTLNGATTYQALIQVKRNAGAQWVIPTVDEWYKAAYYKGGSKNSGYWTYATRSDTLPSNVLSPTGTNNANYQTNGGIYTDPTNYLTPVGAFGASPGPYGTFDQAGDMAQLNETVYSDEQRGLRGGSFESGLMASYYDYYTGVTNENYNNGFRVAELPEPSSIALFALGTIGVWFASRRQRMST